MQQQWRKSFKIWAMAFGIGLLALPALATTDYRGMTTEALSSLRGTMRDATPEERDAFREAWHERLDVMTAEERGQFEACRGCRTREEADGQGQVDNPGCNGCQGRGYGCRLAHEQQE